MSDVVFPVMICQAEVQQCQVPAPAAILDCHLDCTAVGYFAFNLASDVIGYNISVQFWFLYLEDVDLDFLVIKFPQLLLEFVNILTTSTNDDARTSSANSDGNQLQCAFDDDA